MFFWLIFQLTSLGTFSIRNVLLNFLKVLQATFAPETYGEAPKNAWRVNLFLFIVLSILIITSLENIKKMCLIDRRKRLELIKHKE